MLDVLTIEELFVEADVVTGALSVTTGSAVMAVVYTGCVADGTTESVVVEAAGMAV